jgi:hypothetical protein
MGVVVSVSGPLPSGLRIGPLRRISDAVCHVGLRWIEELGKSAAGMAPRGDAGNTISTGMRCVTADQDGQLCGSLSEP